jgi:pimeloyl-ACP methyl ester carboxylesterase
MKRPVDSIGIRLIAGLGLLALLAGCAMFGGHRFNPKTLPSNLKWVMVDGTPIVYEDVGHGDPVLVLTPYPFSTELWDPLVQRLKGSLRLIVVEPPGLRDPGSMKGDFSSEHLMQLYRQFVVAIGVQRVHTLGVGESGMEAIIFGHHFPQYSAAVVSINGFESLTWSKGVSDMIGYYNQATYNGLTGLMSRASIRHRVRPPTRQELNHLFVLPPLEDEKKALESPIHLRFDAYIHDIKSGWVTSMLPTVRQPLLIIRSEKDDLLPEKYIDRTKEQIRLVKVRTDIVEGAGHMAFLDQPDVVADLILKFVSLYPISSSSILD